MLTDAYTHVWEPSDKPFMTCIITFENEGGKTKYTARVLHWSSADRKTHEEMDFHEGWGKATNQLAELLAGYSQQRVQSSPAKPAASTVLVKPCHSEFDVYAKD